mmetsp:Transcript_37951/g.56421  ORF Transcript_37951/g.56421 Transcript_37951/m.56421 type:complete len:965 (-) Transcript_37951:121-3015(-)|eukprot:CAMPEP_0194032548 /NCGR_PEP_ID=MMETSP0009_2-20130614/5468_1 /TAXON_ID=210454 /ORGANISM="Grammatophora oceanica, Strain CCMP 410" /LENGTH=964 /DNA_ID=CAMNT_0038673029 /DNA_START=285 /DNA_END=3179 /DNA_ORIENTATION=-
MSSAADSNPQAGQGRPLPKKESDLFRNVVKFYETKQYKKGIKHADGILKKFPNHGETLCMKGLTLNCLKKREEAHALVKLGLRNDMRSHVCWHVYGLLHRSDRNYNEAIKAYKQALRIDRENLQILRDLSLLQIQMRDLEGFSSSRLTLLQLKPNNKINWISYALGRHGTGDLEGALSVLDAFLNTQDSNSVERSRNFESSELALYRNDILEELAKQQSTTTTNALEQYQAAYAHLMEIEEIVVDRGCWMEKRARYEVHLGKYEEARTTLEQSLERGLTEDYRVHSGYMCALLEVDGTTYDEATLRGGKNGGSGTSGSSTDTLATIQVLSSEQKKRLLDVYQNELLPKYPKSQAVQRIPLTLLLSMDSEKELFRSGVDAYCRKRLIKGVPSLALDLSTFLLEEVDDETTASPGRYRRVTDPIDVKSHPTFCILLDLAKSYIVHLESINKFSPEDDDTTNEKQQQPSEETILWAWYLLAGLYELCGNYAEGMELTDKCLEHTPNAVDVYELKARLQKAAGDMDGAVTSLDKGREMDKQDRYINNLTTKYMLQAGQEEVALERIALFTKHEGNPEDNLYNMQCCWYELELADCLQSKKVWGKSLKKFGAVIKHFDDFHEDQFDFHQYCVRKVTLRAYRDVLLWEDDLFGQEYYGRAAEGIISIYLHLHDANNDPSQGGKGNDGRYGEPDYSTMTAAERKKAKAIARKKKKAAEKKLQQAAAVAEAKKAEEAAAAQKADGSGNNHHNNKKKRQAAIPVVVDNDPDGLELLKKDPLEEAKKYSAILSKSAPKRISTWLIQYDVSIRRGKGLMALQALYKARAIDAEDAGLFERTVDFCTKKDGIASKMNETAKQVLERQTLLLLEPSKSVKEFVGSAKEKIKSDPLTSLPFRAAVAAASVAHCGSSVADASTLVLDGGIDARGVSVDACRDVLETLRTMTKKDGSSKAECDAWIDVVKKRFPLIKNLA